jgi:hypothetical protein
MDAMEERVFVLEALRDLLAPNAQMMHLAELLQHSINTVTQVQELVTMDAKITLQIRRRTDPVVKHGSPVTRQTLLPPEMANVEL